VAATWSLTRQVATGSGGTAATSRTYTLTSGASVAVGSLLVVKVGVVGSPILASPFVTSTASASLSAWPVPANTNPSGTQAPLLAYAVVTGAITNTDTITLTFTANSAPTVTVNEFSAGSTITAASTDKSSPGGTTSAAFNSGTTAALAAADDLVIGIISFDNGTGTNTITPEVLSPAWQSAPTTYQTIGSARDILQWRDPQATTAVRFFGTITGVNSDHREWVVAITATTSGGAAAIPPILVMPRRLAS
jgi:hypothetical protein